MSTQLLYAANNCSTAFQLNWSLSVFGKSGLPSPEPFIDRLATAIAQDNLKILEHRAIDSNVIQFFVSSQPKHSPAYIVRSVKGRWQNVARERQFIEFRRNYRICSVGSAKHEVLDSYVAKQNDNHPMADENVQRLLTSLQYDASSECPFDIKRSAHGEYLNALHLVFETADGWHETSYAILDSYRAKIIESCRQQGWSLSRIGLLSNHLHLLLSAGVDDTPEAIAICLLNDLASTQKVQSVFKHSYYVGTFGKFDRGAIWNRLRTDKIREACRERYW